MQKFRLGSEVIYYSVEKDNLLLGKGFIEKMNNSDNPYFINGKWHPESHISLKNRNNMNKKIIGYKAPYDLYDGRVLKGHLYVKNPRLPDYYPQTIGNGSALYNIAKEIVETWEAVYEEESINLVIGNPIQTIRVSKGKIECEGKQILLKPIQMLANINNNLAIKTMNNWDISIPFIKIGCSTFSIAELRVVLNTYNRLNNNYEEI